MKGYENPELEDFKYRKFIQITGSSGGSQTDYQVMLKIYPGFGQDTGNTIYLMGTARPDLADLRFVDENNKEIPYWIEANLDDVAATIAANVYVYVWVKVPLILSTQATIKMLWGHPTALAKSNGDLTFPLHDHFTGAALDTTKWQTNAVGTLTVSNHILETYVSSNGQERYCYAATGMNVGGNNLCIRARYKSVSRGSSASQVSLCTKYGLSSVMPGDTTSSYKQLNHGIAWGSKWGPAYSDGTYYINELYYDGSAAKFRVNDGSWYSWTVTASTGNPGFRVYCDISGTSKMNVDWALVRKYISPEPVAALTWVG